METFNKTEYNTEYRKKALKEKKKAQFNTDLFYEEKQELEELLESLGMTKASFIRKAKQILERGYYMRKEFYYIERQNLKSDIIDSEVFDNRDEAEKQFNWLKSCNVNSTVSNNEVEYRLICWTVECDEDGEPLENEDGTWNEIDSFTTNKIL